MNDNDTLLVVGHNLNACLPFLPFLKQHNITLTTAENLQKALHFFEDPPKSFAAIIDIDDEKETHLKKLNALRKNSDQRIFLTATELSETAQTLLEAGTVQGFLPKPLSLTQIQTIFTCEEPVEPDRRAAMDRLWKIVGLSTAMQNLCCMIKKVAPTSATVFLIGKSGTGKELIAEAIHQYSQRSKKPYIAINCGTTPQDLISSALFGHEKGSFTGATQNHVGYFAQASGGTLFLDEITEASLDFQIKLLRVLETGMIQPVGSTKEIPVDVRIIASTNRSPKNAIKEGKLREDLYYRLSVFPIFAPTLEEREGDKELLAEHFLNLLNQAEKASVIFSLAALEKIKQLQYSGNVRELKNMVYRAFILADDVIEEEHIQPVMN